MASYHLHAQIIGRAKGHSAIAAAAYRSASRLVDRATGQVHDYSRKRGTVHSEVMLPKGAASWLADREKLWNHVHAREHRHDAQLCREINLALPHELTAEQRLDVLRKFVDTQFVSKGMVADIAVHAPVPERGDDPRNHHAHIMLTFRQISADGLSRIKSRAWNDRAELKRWHAAWNEEQNRALAQFNHRDRVDHRSLKDQRAEALAAGDTARAVVLDRLPEIHIGRRAMAAARNERRPRTSPMPVGLTPLPPPPERALNPPRLRDPVRANEPPSSPPPREMFIEQTQSVSRTPPPPPPNVAPAGEIVDRSAQRAVQHRPAGHVASPPPPQLAATPTAPPPLPVEVPTHPVISAARPPARPSAPPESPPSRPFVQTTWAFAVVPKARDLPAKVRPLFRIVIRESRPHRNWSRKVRHPEHLTRLEFNLKRLQNNHIRVRTWVRSGKATRARLMIEWRQLSRIVTWLKSHGGDPELINQFLTRLAANQRLFWMLAKSIKRMQAEENRLSRRCFEVSLTVRRKRVEQMTAERTARRRRRGRSPHNSSNLTDG